MIKDEIVPKQPMRRTGLRPIRSDKEPQNLGDLSLMTCLYKSSCRIDAHASQGLRQREGRDEDAGVKRGIILASDLEM